MYRVTEKALANYCTAQTKGVLLHTILQGHSVPQVSPSDASECIDDGSPCGLRALCKPCGKHLASATFHFVIPTPDIIQLCFRNT